MRKMTVGERLVYGLVCKCGASAVVWVGSFDAWVCSDCATKCGCGEPLPFGAACCEDCFESGSADRGAA